MDSQVLLLGCTPMPYLTTCNLKRFGAHEYHCSRFCEYFVLIFMLSNHLKFTEDATPTTLSAGEWYIQRKDVWQDALVPSPNAAYYYLHFEAQYATEPLNRIQLPIHGRFQQALFLPLLEQLRSLCAQPLQNPLEIQAGFYNLLNLLYPQESSRSPLTASVTEYLSSNYALSITSRELSERFHYSSEYINRHLKAEIGMTAHAYLTHIRIMNATRLLTYSKKTITEISQECGYSDVSLFYKAFRSLHGVGPSAYRKQKQAPQPL